MDFTFKMLFSLKHKNLINMEKGYRILHNDMIYVLIILRISHHDIFILIQKSSQLVFMSTISLSFYSLELLFDFLYTKCLLVNQMRNYTKMFSFMLVDLRVKEDVREQDFTLQAK